MGARPVEEARAMAHSPTSASPGLSHRGHHIALWTAQVLLALAFGSAGVMKTTMPVATLVQNGMVWTGDVPAWLVRAIGACELAAAIGLILPSLTGIRPDLTPLAALGLLTIMVLAMAFHISRGEPQMIPMNMMLGGIAAFVASGRHTKAPIEPRSG
jgi:putative oxidoreductase